MLPGALKVWLAAAPVSMTKSIDGLIMSATTQLNKDASADGVFVFINAKRDRAKLLWRDKSGWCLLYKRLDTKLIAEVHMTAGETCAVIDAQQLALLLEGADKRRGRREKVKSARDLALSRMSSVTTIMRREPSRPHP
jgi:transposase